MDRALIQKIGRLVANILGRRVSVDERYEMKKKVRALRDREAEMRAEVNAHTSPVTRKSPNSR
jgi:hypothetical protein